MLVIPIQMSRWYNSWGRAERAWSVYRHPSVICIFFKQSRLSKRSHPHSPHTALQNSPLALSWNWDHSQSLTFPFVFESGWKKGQDPCFPIHILLLTLLRENRHLFVHRFSLVQGDMKSGYIPKQPSLGFFKAVAQTSKFGINRMVSLGLFARTDLRKSLSPVNLPVFTSPTSPSKGRRTLRDKEG